MDAIVKQCPNDASIPTRWIFLVEIDQEKLVATDGRLHSVSGISEYFLLHLYFYKEPDDSEHFFILLFGLLIFMKSMNPFLLMGAVFRIFLRVVCHLFLIFT